MKSLDEIIKALSIPAVNGYHYIDSNDAIDALNYLKWFWARDSMSRKLDREDNEPLTWDELRTMEGKPVWVEPVREWMLITETEIDEGAERVWLLSQDGMDYDLYQHDWQAYRKEI